MKIILTFVAFLLLVFGTQACKNKPSTEPADLVFNTATISLQNIATIDKNADASGTFPTELNSKYVLMDCSKTLTCARSDTGWTMMDEHGIYNGPVDRQTLAITINQAAGMVTAISWKSTTYEHHDTPGAYQSEKNHLDEFFLKNIPFAIQGDGSLVCEIHGDAVRRALNGFIINDDGFQIDYFSSDPANRYRSWNYGVKCYRIQPDTAVIRVVLK